MKKYDCHTDVITRQIGGGTLSILAFSKKTMSIVYPIVFTTTLLGCTAYFLGKESTLSDDLERATSCKDIVQLCKRIGKSSDAMTDELITAFSLQPLSETCMSKLSELHKAHGSDLGENGFAINVVWSAVVYHSLYAEHNVSSQETNVPSTPPRTPCNESQWPRTMTFVTSWLTTKQPFFFRVPVHHHPPPCDECQ